MPIAFLSHKSLDKKIVLDVERHLKRSLIETWIDMDGMQGGDTLSNKILEGINHSQVFIAFISEKYFDSHWCPEEFKRAYQLRLKGIIKIIPVLIGDVKAILEKSSENTIINSILDEVKYIEYDIYDPLKSNEEIVKAVWKGELIRFRPIKDLNINNIQLQVISFETEKDIPSDYLMSWQFKLDKFIAEGIGGDAPIRFGTALVFFGRGPNWLYTFLTIPLANKRNIFVYNSFTDDFICVYAISSSKELLGTTFRYKFE